MENKTKSTNLHIRSYAEAAAAAAMEILEPSNSKWCIINKMFMGTDINRKTIYSLSNKSRMYSYASDVIAHTHTPGRNVETSSVLTRFSANMKNIVSVLALNAASKCKRTYRDACAFLIEIDMEKGRRKNERCEPREISKRVHYHIKCIRSKLYTYRIDWYQADCTQ